MQPRELPASAIRPKRIRGGRTSFFIIKQNLQPGKELPFSYNDEFGLIPKEAWRTRPGVAMTNLVVIASEREAIQRGRAGAVGLDRRVGLRPPRDDDSCRLHLALAGSAPPSPLRTRIGRNRLVGAAPAESTRNSAGSTQPPSHSEFALIFRVRLTAPADAFRHLYCAGVPPSSG